VSEFVEFMSTVDGHILNARHARVVDATVGTCRYMCVCINIYKHNLCKLMQTYM
jgi:hypothetical protein